MKEWKESLKKTCISKEPGAWRSKGAGAEKMMDAEGDG